MVIWKMWRWSIEDMMVVINIVWNRCWLMVVIVSIVRVGSRSIVGMMVEMVVIVGVVVVDMGPVYAASYIVTKFLIIVAATLLVIHQKLKCCVTILCYNA